MSPLESLHAILRERRIKDGVDYSITLKYGAVRVLCDEVWKPAVEEAASQCGIRIAAWFTY